jgi:hypothetical protein
MAVAIPNTKKEDYFNGENALEGNPKDIFFAPFRNDKISGGLSFLML